MKVKRPVPPVKSDISIELTELDENVKKDESTLSLISWFVGLLYVFLVLVMAGMFKSWIIIFVGLMFIEVIFECLPLFHPKFIRERINQKRERRIELNRESDADYWKDYRLYEKQLSDFKRSYSEEFNSSFSLRLDKLDSIKKNFLFRKPINSSNESFLEEYKNRIIDIQNDVGERKRNDDDFMLDYGIAKRICDHNNYLETRLTQRTSSNYRSNSKTRIKEITPEITKEQKAIISLDEFLDKMLVTKKSKHDFALSRTKLGEQGEDFYMEVEKKKLKNLGIDSDKYPVHVSKLHGDQFGFDILSLDEDLKPLLLEVKTTTKKKKASFYLTKNELEKMKNYKDSYRIVRIYKFDRELKEGKHHSIKYSDLYSKFKMEMQVYKVSNIEDSNPTLLS